eukprot:4013187-Pleurochrysis_carterae.AAC.1
MPERLKFKFEGWANKNNYCVRLHFDFDNTHGTVYLHQLFNHPWGFQFIPGANGRVPRRVAAFRARMERAAEMAAPGPDTRRFVDIAYVEGQMEKSQR